MEPLDFTLANSATSQPNIFTRVFQFPLHSKDLEVAMVSAVIPNSMFNFDSSNNQFWYRYQGTNYLVDLGNSFLDINGINTALQRAFLANNHYLVDANGLPVFLITFGLLEATYKFQITFNTLVLGSNTNPNSLVLDGKTMQIVLNSNGFGRRIGFNPNQSIPSSPSSLILIIPSDNVPFITDLQAINVTLPQFVSSIGYSSVPCSVRTIPIIAGQGYPNNITDVPTNLLWYQVNNGIYDRITCRLTDQAGRDLNMIDQNVVLTFQFRSRLRT